MILEERKCPNCGSNDILEKNGTFVCMNCRTFFDDPRDITITHVERNETEIERIRSQERLKDSKLREKKRQDEQAIKVASICFGFSLLMAIIVLLVLKL